MEVSVPRPLEVLAEVAARPTLRGRSHFYAFFASLALGVGLIVAAVPHGTAAVTACAVYAGSVSGLLGTSATYHRVRWRRLGALLWMRRLDHSMIFVLIAGTYTPVAVLALDGTLRVVLLGLAWGGALGGIALKLLWIGHPRWLSSVVYLALGWLAVIAAKPLVDAIGWTGASLFAAGGLLYSAGAIVYARQRPNPRPGVFGFHEVFHALVVAALLTHWAGVAFTVLPQA